MKIKILRLGHSARTADAAAGTTIAELLDREDVPSAGHAISVNGLGASGSTGLSDGDVVTLVPKVEGGC
jgi:sulfur carrier protein ThiS